MFQVDTNGDSTVIKESSIKIYFECCNRVQDILKLGGTTDYRYQFALSKCLERTFLCAPKHGRNRKG